MVRDDDESAVNEFEERLARWGRRPPLLPPQLAARRVVGKLPEPRPGRQWLRLAVAGAMLVLVAIAVWHAARPHAVAAGGSDVVATQGVVQFWLDSTTPVYFVLQRFGNEKGESS